MKKEAWIVAADMGYGHQRAAYPLKDIAYDRIINANSDKMISPEEKKVWERARSFYENVSRAAEFPVIGKTIFEIYNNLQKIDPYYPRSPNMFPKAQVKYLEKKIQDGICKSLIYYVQKKKIPFVTTYFIPAMAANYYKLPKIYCILTDSDVSRIWVPSDPVSSTITYFAPCQHSVNRLLSYGIKQENIILTGFPLPKECVGKNSEIAKKSLTERILKLDPNKIFIKQNIETLKSALGSRISGKASKKPVTIAFVIGGAGAQKEIGLELIKGLKKKIIEEKIKLILVAGTHLDLKQYFVDEIKKEGLGKLAPKHISIICEIAKKDYFAKFNEMLNETDILMTKPSELSFYAGLGIPIVIAPPIGDHEGWNKKWLFEIGAGIEQENPNYAGEWLDEWISDGRLARLAWNGYLNAPRMGTYEIEKALFGS